MRNDVYRLTRLHAYWLTRKGFARTCQGVAMHFAKHTQAQSACLSVGSTWVQLG